MKLTDWPWDKIVDTCLAMVVSLLWAAINHWIFNNFFPLWANCLICGLLGVYVALRP